MHLPFVFKCDWLLNLISRINGFTVDGIEFIPLCVIVRDLSNKTLINHETIHYHQMLETAFIGFYLIYAGHYLYLRAKGLGHFQAYKSICFEVEAYANQNKPKYLNKRKHFAWV